MDRWIGLLYFPAMGVIYVDLLALLQTTGSGGTGVDPTLFWAILVALGGTVTTLAGVIYNTQRKRIADLERELSAYRQEAPELADNVRWLVDEAEAQRRSAAGHPSTWPLRRDQTQRPISHPTTRRRTP